MTSLVIFGGCAVGYNETVFYTRSNFGLNVTTTPPVAEISLARREGVIGPTFEGGQHVPVYASFHIDTRGLLPVSTDVAGLFAGGAAAAIVADQQKTTFDETNASDQRLGRICVSMPPTDLPFGLKVPGPGTVHPFVFGTDTTTGLKIAWTGATSAVPDTVTFGYNRKELALAPIFLAAETSDPDCRNVIRTPSFIAKVDNGFTAGSPGSSGFKVNQYFATGAAASKLATVPRIKDKFVEDIVTHTPP